MHTPITLGTPYQYILRNNNDYNDSNKIKRPRQQQQQRKQGVTQRPHPHRPADS